MGQTLFISVHNNLRLHQRESPSGSSCTHREQDCDALVLFCLTVERVVVLSVNCVDCDLNVTQIRARVCIRCALLCAYMLL